LPSRGCEGISTVAEEQIRRRLAAIIVADAAGYSRLMSADERATLATLEAARRLFRTQVEANQGRVVDMAGDSVLAVFETAIGAVSAALAVQRDIDAVQSAAPEDRHLRFRIGVHLGDVIEKTDGSVYGDGVNIAARLQALAEIGGITISDPVHGAVRGKVLASFVDQGEQLVKNFPHPVRWFVVHADRSATTPAPPFPRAPLTVPERPSLAVLPFTNLSGDPEQDYFADGMAEDIITALARMGLFFVIARNSSFVYRGKAVDIKRVGRELGVRYVLEGSVRKSGNRVRITGQLVEAERGHHVWADRFEGTLGEVFELQDRMTESIVSAVEPNVRRAEIERVRTKPTSSPQAYDLLLRALPVATTPGSTKAANDEALSFIRRALEMDAQYGLAKAIGASLCGARVLDGYGDAEDVKSALRYADDALSEKCDDPVVLSLAGMTLGSMGYRVLGVRVMGFRYDESQRAIDRALSLSPNLLMVQYCAGTIKAFLGEGDAALNHFERAMRISPVDPATGAFILGSAAAHLVSGRYDEALATVQRAIQEIPNSATGHRLMLLALGYLGRVDEARLIAQRVLELAPEFTVSRSLSTSPFKDAEFRKRAAKIYQAAGVPK
jgi:adenylate cyclase